MKGKTVSRKLVQFGAGNIGRSFIGQLFARNGYEVVFVDIDETLVREINARKQYRVIIKRNERPDEAIVVKNVRAVDGRDTGQVAREIQTAGYLSTSVGKGALPSIMQPIAEGLEIRFSSHVSRPPLDIIIAENIRNGAAYFREELAKLLPPGFAFEEKTGFVETSIGKMVPIMKAEDTARDPLWVFAEEYNALIVDRRGFVFGVPPFPQIKAVENITAYVDRKLFIHNLGHAAAAYLGYRENPDYMYIWEALENPDLFDTVRACMEESGRALHAEYPEDLPEKDLKKHIDDLLRRFRNKALGDTIFRVGRDLYRKLQKNDRLIGALLLAGKQGCPYDNIASATAESFFFRAGDEQGEMYPRDAEFAQNEFPKGPEHILTAVSGLSKNNGLEKAVMEKVIGEYRRLEGDG